MELGIAEIRNFMLRHQLKFIDTKTEIIISGSENSFSKIPITNFTIGNKNITSKNSVRNFGVIFDNHMSLDSHINSISKKVNISLIFVTSDHTFQNQIQKN